MIRAAVVFIVFAFIYTVLFYTLTPVVDAILDAFILNVDTSSWSEDAVQTYDRVLTLVRYGWFWGCILGFITTLIWYFVYPYIREVLTRYEYV